MREGKGDLPKEVPVNICKGHVTDPTDRHLKSPGRTVREEGEQTGRGPVSSRNCRGV